MSDFPTFFNVPAPLKVGDIARLCQCTLREGDDPNIEVVGVGPVEAAGPGMLTFVSNPKYLKDLAATKASAVICSAKHAEQVPADIAVLHSTQAYRSFTMAVGVMYPDAMRPQSITGETGISSAAHVHGDARLEDGVIVEAGAVIGAGAEIGSGTIIGPNAIVGPGVSIGRECNVCAGASVTHSLMGNNVIVHSGARIGTDGFGYSMGADGHLKLPQVGRVVLQDSVEIGANTTIDRGANRDTIVGEGTKIDNSVQIAHNVVIGRHCVITAQVGIAGSAVLGDYVAIGGQAGLNGHIRIGNGVQIAGSSAVFDDIPDGARYGGIPARPVGHWMRELARLKQEAGTKKAKND